MHSTLINKKSVVDERFKEQNLRIMPSISKKYFTEVYSTLFVPTKIK